MAVAYLLGRPVLHSLSPALHNAAFAALGLPHRYVVREVADDDLRQAVEALRGGDTLGANVTIPHKEAVLRLMDEVRDDARRIGAVNTIVRRGSRLEGENTDLFGFEAALRHAGIVLEAKRVLVLGAGGAARAVVLSLLRGRNDVCVANRTRERAAALVGSLVGEDGERADVGEWPDEESIGDLDAVVNATPLGLVGEDPLAGLALPRDLCVIDLVPTGDETPLVRRARAAECTVVDGLLMLLHQAARSFTLWTGVDAPLAVMRAALPRSP